MTWEIFIYKKRTSYITIWKQCYKKKKKKKKRESVTVI